MPSGDRAHPPRGESGPPEPSRPEPGRPRVRRYSLARVGVSPRSALGTDWHGRLEDAAEPRDR